MPLRRCFEDAAQVLQLLAHLIEHRDKVVPKQQLVESVWNCRAVSDAAVTTRINVLRVLVGDSGRQQRLIKTYPRKGFRFVGDVQALQPRAVQPTLAATDLPSIAVLAFANP